MAAVESGDACVVAVVAVVEGVEGVAVAEGPEAQPASVAVSATQPSKKRLRDGTVGWCMPSIFPAMATGRAARGLCRMVQQGWPDIEQRRWQADQRQQPKEGR